MRNCALLTGLMLSVTTGWSFADNPVDTSPVSMANTLSGPLGSDGSDYWTAERYKAAKPIPLPSAEIDADAVARTQELEDDGQQDREIEAVSGSPPTVETDQLDGVHQQLFEPDEDSEGSEDAPETDGFKLPSKGLSPTDNRITPQDTGTAGAYFSSQQLVPLTADLSYPYSAVGKLFFTIPGRGDATCSAAVIAPRIILTAGHCVHSGTSSGFHINFRFIPAFRDGAAPYGAWDWNYVTVTNTWITGGGGFPNAADYALIELKDNTISAAVRRIGTVTGWLGYSLNSLALNHVHMLGYPVAFDNGNRMHQVTSQSYGSGGNNTVLYGTDMTQGSSGGPWIMNFGSASAGQTGGLQPARNAIVGVMSYGPNNSAIKHAGSSILDTRLSGLYNAICAHKTGNCN